jgi:Txe/YoeB family toxin of Txe-Axe toxin-antitoxin module
VPFRLFFTPTAQEDYDSIRDAKRKKKVDRTLAKLSSDPGYQGLATHRYEALDGVYGHSNVWESYVENRTPGAWRIWWAYGPKRGQITVLMIGAHP